MPTSKKSIKKIVLTLFEIDVCPKICMFFEKVFDVGYRII